jgi:hypothetical protein
MIKYSKPTESQIQIVKEIFEYQNQIDNADSILEIESIVGKAYDSIKPISTATFTLHNGTTKDFSQSKEDFLVVLKYDLNTYSTIQDLKVGIILTLDLLMHTFIVERKKVIEILNS